MIGAAPADSRVSTTRTKGSDVVGILVAIFLTIAMATLFLFLFYKIIFFLFLDSNLRRLTNTFYDAPLLVINEKETQFLSNDYSNRISTSLNYAKHNREVILLAGEEGFGKTTTIRNVLSNTKQPYIYLHMRDGFSWPFLLETLNLKACVHHCKEDITKAMNQFLMNYHETFPLVVIDHAEKQTGISSTFVEIWNNSQFKFGLVLVVNSRTIFQFPTFGGRVNIVELENLSNVEAIQYLHTLNVTDSHEISQILEIGGTSLVHLNKIRFLKQENTENLIEAYEKMIEKIFETSILSLPSHVQDSLISVAYFVLYDKELEVIMKKWKNIPQDHINTICSSMLIKCKLLKIEFQDAPVARFFKKQFVSIASKSIAIVH